MTIIRKMPEVTHIYNKKDEELIIVLKGDNNSIYTIGGWFGVMFSEFLQGNGEVDQFLERLPFEDNLKLQILFKRIISTLMRENILYSSEWDDSVMPFTEEEGKEFGEGDLKGYFTVKNLEDSFDHSIGDPADDYHAPHDILIQNENMHFMYDEESKKLCICFSDENNSIYAIGGWFGEKIYEFLKSSDSVKLFLSNPPFKDNDRLKDVFNRLLMTLARENILSPYATRFFTPATPFSKEEYSSFGMGNFTGNFTFVSGESLLAYAHDQCQLEANCYRSGRYFSGLGRIYVDTVYRYGEGWYGPCRNNVDLWSDAGPLCGGEGYVDYYRTVPYYHIHH